MLYLYILVLCDWQLVILHFSETTECTAAISVVSDIIFLSTSGML